MGGIKAFRAQLAAHLATYAASGGTAPVKVLAARGADSRGGVHNMACLEGGVVWYPVRHMKFVRTSQLSLPPCVLDGPEQEQPASEAAALLHVFAPAVQAVDTDAVCAAGSALAGTLMPGRLQLPGNWQQLACLEVTVSTRGAVPHLYPPAGWGELRHLQDCFMLALSMVSGSLTALALSELQHCYQRCTAVGVAR
jgi:hypothetical protein